jgi:hypothetical protein
LVRLNLTLMTWIRETLWDSPWGILVESDLDLTELRRHLRRFLLVEDPQGQTRYFRFYDPRVLRTFLLTCSHMELDEFFGPVTAYVVRGPQLDQFTRFALTAAEFAPFSRPGISPRRQSQELR